MGLELRRPDVDYQENPAPSHVSMARVQEYASDLSRRLEVAALDRLDGLVSSLGGRLHFCGWDWSAPSGTIYVHKPGDFDIVVGDPAASARERFTIAHELGHYFVHSSMGKKPIIAPRASVGGGGRLEWEANWFAAGFLMPPDEFKRAFAECRRDLETVAAKFFVSTKAAEVRAQVLGLRK